MQTTIPELINSETSNPRADYVGLLAQRRDEERRQARLERIAGNSRVLVFGLGMLLTWFALATGYLAPAWLALPLASFIGFVVWHHRIELARTRAAPAGSPSMNEG